MRTKTRASLVAAVLGVALFAAGCSGNQGTPQGGSSTTSGTAGTNEKIGAVSVIGVWGGTELDSFKKVAKGWEDQTGGTMNFEGTRDLSAILRARVQGGNPPDVAILPNPAIMKQFKTKITPLSGVVDQTTLNQQYDQKWIELGTVDGKLLGLVVKAAPKSTVWYNPKRFSEKNYAVPKSWSDLQTLTHVMRNDGGEAPWALGLESGGASGWPGSDWIQEIYLAQNGPDMYDKWTSHQIPWTDPTIKTAFETFGKMVLPAGSVTGGEQTIVSMTPNDASFLPYDSPPKADMYFQGSFAQGFIAAQFPNLKPVTGYDFFDFPAINTQFKSPATFGGDTIVIFNDTPSARSLVQYLAKGTNWESWIKSGGFTSPTKSVNASAYPDEIGKKLADQLSTADPLRFDADDLMPAELQTAYFKGIIDYVQNPGDINRILSDIESTAKSAYQSTGQ